MKGFRIKSGESVRRWLQLSSQEVMMVRLEPVESAMSASSSNRIC